MSLEVHDAYPAWHGATFRGHFDGDEVLVLLGPEGADSDALSRASGAASGALGLRRDGVLPLLSVERVQHRIAWVYQDCQGLGLTRLVGSDGIAVMPVRVATELVARLADVLLGLGDSAYEHPGPEPHDVLIDASSNVWVAGFTGPFAPSPNTRAPGTEEGEAALVFRLGVLLAQLVSGREPSWGSDRSAHEASIRRTLIQSMSRPGAVISDRFADWLRGMLAWDASARPPLSRLPEGLRQVADATGGPDLAEWTRANLPRLIDAAGRTKPATPGTPRPRQRVTAVVDSFDDEPTLEAPTGPVKLPRFKAQPAPKNTIPVSVGPPPEAVQNPRLPDGFLDPNASEDTDAQIPVFEPTLDRSNLRLITVSLLLGIGLLVAYLLS